MKSCLTLAALTVFTLQAAATAGEEYLYPPVAPPAVAPGSPYVAPPAPAPYGAPAPYVAPAPHGHHVAPLPAPAVTNYPPIGGDFGHHGHGNLFHNVEIEDPENIHPCAVHKVICLPMGKGGCRLFGHRGDDCGCGPELVYVKICVPPGPCERVKRSKDGSKVKYDYGKYEVEVQARNGRVKVDYDD